MFIIDNLHVQMQLLTNQSLEASYISSLPNSAIAFPTIFEV